MRVALDPGHFQGHNVGCDKAYAEGTRMFLYANLLADRLRDRGIEVVLTRQKAEDNPSLTARGKLAQGCDMFLSLHSNAASASSAHGVSVFYSIKRDNKALAEMFAAGLAALINGGTRNRGALTRQGGGDWDYYTVIQSAAKTDCPRILLIEHGFHSHKEECAWLLQDVNLCQMADAECRWICDEVGMTEKKKPVGWVKSDIDRRWRYYEAPGALVRDRWFQYNQKWYYLMADGTMAEGWIQREGKWYYLMPYTGEMATGIVLVDGKEEEFDKDGVWQG